MIHFGKFHSYWVRYILLFLFSIIFGFFFVCLNQNCDPVSFDEEELGGPPTALNATELNPPSVILKPHGGIGNQLFQYACLFALAQSKNLPLYTVFFKPEHRSFLPQERVFAIDQFSIPLDNLIDPETEIAQNLVEQFDDEQLLNSRDKLGKSGNKFLYHVANGYCQSEVYWREYRETIKSMFRIKEEVAIPQNNINLADILDQIRNTESVALHVRRGDFLKASGFYIPISFQRQAIRKFLQVFQEKFKGRKTTESLVFYIFSDDIKYTKESLSDIEEKLKLKFVYVSLLNTTSTQDMFLMTQCKHIIFPNSTFSWWAAYLNENLEKIVITSAFNPRFWKKWSGKRKQFFRHLHGQLYHPLEWIIIDPFVSNGIL